MTYSPATEWDGTRKQPQTNGGPGPRRRGHKKGTVTVRDGVTNFVVAGPSHRLIKAAKMSRLNGNLPANVDSVSSNIFIVGQVYWWGRWKWAGLQVSFGKTCHLCPYFMTQTLCGLVTMCLALQRKGTRYETGHSHNMTPPDGLIHFLRKRIQIPFFEKNWLNLAHRDLSLSLITLHNAKFSYKNDGLFRYVGHKTLNSFSSKITLWNFNFKLL